jgi:hypothetical protein
VVSQRFGQEGVKRKVETAHAGIHLCVIKGKLVDADFCVILLLQFWPSHLVVKSGFIVSWNKEQRASSLLDVLVDRPVRYTRISGDPMDGFWM